METTCSICGTEPKSREGEFDRDIAHIHCSICGRYSITHVAEIELRQNKQYQAKKYLLSGVLRDATERGNQTFIRSDNIDDLLSAAIVPNSPFEALDRILIYISKKMQTIESYVDVPFTDYPIVYAKGERELQFYIDKLFELKRIERQRGNLFRLTLEGWQRVEELQKVGIQSNQAFVAMWFSEETREAWTAGFEPALTDSGYSPIRIDLVQHNEKIDDRIITEIRRSGLLIADFTGSRGGVYFEAGFAMGLGIPVIWTCREDWIDKLHFDTRQYNHIVWKEPSDLKEQLYFRIEATL